MFVSSLIKALYHGHLRTSTSIQQIVAFTTFTSIKPKNNIV